MLIDVEKSLFQLKTKKLDTSQDSQSLDVCDDSKSLIDQNCESSESLEVPVTIDPIESSNFIHSQFRVILIFFSNIYFYIYTEGEKSHENNTKYIRENTDPSIKYSALNYLGFKNKIRLKEGSYGEIVVAEYAADAADGKQKDDMKSKERDQLSSSSLIDLQVDPKNVYILKFYHFSDFGLKEASTLQELNHHYIIKYYSLVDCSVELNKTKVASGTLQFIHTP